jgi:2'-5' RNA ligase
MPLYFVALMVPWPFSDEINKIRTGIAQQFGCWHALKTPPHITLQPPFRTQSDGNELLKILQPVSQHHSSFSIRTGPVNAFANRVAYLEVIAPPILFQMQQQVCHLLEEKKLVRPDRRVFHPHITLAHRDIPGERMPDIKRFAEQMQSFWEFKVQELTLLIHRNGQWQVNGTLALSE